MFNKNSEWKKAKTRTVKNTALKASKVDKSSMSATLRIGDTSHKVQVVGVKGGSIEPTAIDVRVFKEALGDVESDKVATGSKLGMSKTNYNSAWQHALSIQDTEVDSANELAYGGKQGLQ